MLSFPELRKEIIKYCVLMYENNYVVASDGNISVRISEGHFLITPSDKRKAELEYKDLIVINKEGNVIEGNFTPSKEMWMHIWIYEMRPDVNAVIHAHPPYSTAFPSRCPENTFLSYLKLKFSLERLALFHTEKPAPWNWQNL